MTPPLQPAHCECDWTYHRGQPCLREPHNEPGVIISPALCTPCLFICAGEADDDRDARAERVAVNPRDIAP